MLPGTGVAAAPGKRRPRARPGPSADPKDSVAPAGGGALQSFLVFSLTSERFAIPAGTVQEIVRAVAIAALPGAPSVVEGVINFRGRIVPVVDPRHRFGMPEVPLHPDQIFIVATAGPRLVALWVDRATELTTIPLDAIDHAADVAPTAPYITGVARLPDGLLVIHDLERFLSLDETARLDLALQQAASSALGSEEASQ